MFFGRSTMYSHFFRLLSQNKFSIKKIYETKIIPPLPRKRIKRSKGPIKTTFELYKESKLPFYLRAPYLRKKEKLDAKYTEFMKIREKNAFKLYKNRGQIRVHSLSVRANELERGWFCFVPPNPKTEDMRKYFHEDREQYEKFINDINDPYPCCDEFTKVPRECERFRERRPGRCGIKVIDKFFQRNDLLIQPTNTQHILFDSNIEKKQKK